MTARAVTPVDEIVLLTGNAHPELAAEIAGLLKVELYKRDVGSFLDGEAKVGIQQDVRGRDVFILQPTHQPDRNQTEIELLVSAMRNSAGRITPVIPYLGYARQDRRDQPRVPISVINRIRNLVNTGIDGVVLFDVHSFGSVGYFEAVNPRIRTDHLFSRPVLLDWLVQQDLSNVTLAATDAGGGKMVETLCKRLGQLGHHVEFGVGYKSGSSDLGINGLKLLGEYEGRQTIFIDDMTASGSTANNAATAAKESGASTVTFVAVHPVLADDEVCHRLAQGPIDDLVMTNSLPIAGRHREILGDKLTVISVAPLLAKAIRGLHECRSLSALFELEGYRFAAMDQ